MDLETLGLAGRVLTGATFVFIGLRMFGALDMVAGILAPKRIPYPKFVAAAGAAVWIVFGAMLAFGIWPAGAALVLAVFLVAATVMVHDFWNLAGHARAEAVNVVLSNLMIVGGLLALAAA